MGQHAQPQVVETEPSGVVWVKSSASGGNSDACVELSLGALVMVRDSRDRHGPYLSFSSRAWQKFLARTSA